MPKYLKNAQSKIKKDLDERRAALRRDKRHADVAKAELLAGQRRSSRTALDIADAFLKSPLVSDWNLEGPPDDDDDELIPEEEEEDGSEEEERLSSPPTQPYVGWLGDYGPLHTRANNVTPHDDEARSAQTLERDAGEAQNDEEEEDNDEATEADHYNDEGEAAGSLG